MVDWEHYSNNTNGIVTIDPIGTDTITLQFTSFGFATNDSLIIYNGTSTNAPLLDVLSYGSNPTTIIADSGAVTIRQYSNSVDVHSGFALKWSIPYSKSNPTASFQPSTVNAPFNTFIKFNNTSIGGGQNYWDFGDGTTSMEKEPLHKYIKSGSFKVRLIVENCISRDTSNYVTIDVDGAPKIIVAPKSLTDTLWVGDTVAHYIQIANKGGGSLIQSFQPFNGHLNLLDTMDVLIYTNTGTNTNFKTIDTILSVYLPNCRKWYYDRNDHELLKRYLSYCGAVIIVGNTLTYSVAKDTAILRHFVNQGGNVILISGSNHYNVIFTSGLIEGSSNGYSSYGSHILDTNNAILKGFPKYLGIGGDKIHVHSITSTNFESLSLVNGVNCIVSKNIGNGKAYVLGINYEKYFHWWNEFLSRVVKEGSNYAPHWLIYPNDTTIFSPLDSNKYEVVFDSRGLREGTYTYDLKVQSNDISKPVEIITCKLKVFQPAEAKFKVDKHLACDGKFYFTNHSMGRVTRWKWFFGDGDSTFDEHPIHTYKKHGIYDVTLIVWNNSTSDTLIRKRDVNFDPSTPNCGSINMVSGKIITVDACSGTIFDNGGPNATSQKNTTDTIIIAPKFKGVIRLDVSFSSGTYDFIKIFVKKYSFWSLILSKQGSFSGNFTSTSGMFMVVIESSGGADCELKYYTETENSMHLNSDFIVSDTLIPFNSPVFFTDKSQPDSILYSWKYHFDDGTFDAKPITEHSYTKSGYYATYLVTSSCHRSDTSKIIPITIHKAPKMLLSPNSFVDTLKAGEIKKRKVLVKNIGDGPLVIWDIYYHGYNILQVEDFQDTVQKGDSVYVNFIISANNQNSANYTDFSYIGSNDTAHLKNKISATIHVLNNAFSKFDVDSTNRCTGTYKFINSSLNSPKFIRWDFGDGYTSVEQNPTHTFNYEGVFRVSLMVGDTGVFHTSTRLISYKKSEFACDKVWMAPGKTTETNACNGVFYDNGGPTKNYVKANYDTLVIRPKGAKSIVINFDSFNILYDVYYTLDLYDGEIKSSNKIDSYRGNTLPNKGADINITNGFATLVFYADNDGEHPGFQGRWTTKSDTGIVSANFISSDSVLKYNQFNRFEDKSKTAPKEWLWKFGNGQMSIEQNPLVKTNVSDSLVATLIITQNCISVDSITKKIPVNPLLTYLPIIRNQSTTPLVYTIR